MKSGVLAAAIAAAIYPGIARGTTEVAKLTIGDPLHGSEFGRSVAIDGDYIAVGDTREVETILNPSVAKLRDFFGAAAAISGEWTVIGARGDDDAGSTTGTAYVFRNTDGTWVEDAELLATDAVGLSSFASSVVIEDGTLLAGSEGDDRPGPNAGSAYVFKLASMGWEEVEKLPSSDSTFGLGSSAAVNGNTAVVGTFGGGAYVFTLPEDVPTMSDWRLLVTALLIAGAAALVIRRTPMQTVRSAPTATRTASPMSAISTAEPATIVTATPSLMSATGR